MKETENKYVIRFSVIIPFVIVIIVGVFFCFCKSGFYEDEIITYGLANSHNAAWIYDVREDFSEKNMTDSILHRNEILSYLTVDPGQRFDLASAYMNQTHDVHPPLYYILVNLVSSFSVSHFTKTGPMCLNLTIWILSLVVLYNLCKLTYHDKISSGICILLYGLCIGGISNLLFIRMYILLSFFTILLAYGLVVLASNTQKKRLTVYGLISLTIAGGLLTQYNFFVIAFFMCLVFFVYFLKTDMSKAVHLLTYASTGIILFVMCFPYFFKQLSVGVNSGSISGDSTIRNILNTQMWITRICYGLVELGNSSISIIVLLLLLLIMPIILFINHDALPDKLTDVIKPSQEFNDTLKYPVFIFVSVFLSVCSISIMNPIIIDRYYFYAIPLFSYVVGFIIHSCTYIAKNVISCISPKHIYISHISAFVIVLVVSAYILMNHPPSFLYLNYPEYIDSISSFEHAPTVYIASNTYKAVHDQSLQFWLYSDDVFIADMDKLDSEKLLQYIKSHTSNSDLLLYVDTYIDDPIPVITSVMNQFHYSEVQPLFDTERTYVVRLY